MAVCSFAHCEAALSLRAAYSDHQIGAFENFHQPVSHLFLPIKQMPANKNKQEIKLLFGNIPTFLSCPIKFYFNALSAR
jgi:hypothetical protein